jgi:hypothetical protein
MGEDVPHAIHYGGIMPLRILDEGESRKTRPAEDRLPRNSEGASPCAL